MTAAPVWLLVEDVATELQVSTDTVYREVRRGALPAVRIGRLTRVSRADLTAYLQARSTTNQLARRRRSA